VLEQIAQFPCNSRLRGRGNVVPMEVMGRFIKLTISIFYCSAAYHLLGTEDQTVMADYLDLDGSTFSYRDFFHEQDGAGDLEAIREAAQQGKAWGRT
jgi:hypothetical protein